MLNYAGDTCDASEAGKHRWRSTTFTRLVLAAVSALTTAANPDPNLITEPTNPNPNRTAIV